MKKIDIVNAINQLKNVSRFGSGDLAGLDSYLIFKDGFISAFATSIAVSVAIDVDFEVAVSADEFSKFIGKIKADEFEIKQKDNEILISYGKTKAGFQTADVMGDIPELSIGKVTKWMKVPDDFREALRLCQFSIMDNVMAGVFACACVMPDGIFSSDNVRLTERKFEKKAVKDFSFFIPKKLVGPVIDFKCEKIGLVDGWVHIKGNDGSFMSLQGVVGECPEYDDAFNVDGVEIVMPPSLLDALDLVYSVSEKGNNDQLVSVHIENDEIICRIDGAKAWAEEKVKCEYSDIPLDFATSSIFLKDILPVCRQFIVGENAILINGENFKHVMAMVQK